MKPILRWAGSKTQILGTLKNFWDPNFQRYVEPFCGSASLFFSVAPPKALLSDLNSELIVTIQQIQVAPSKVLECIARYPANKNSYYSIRSIDPKTLSDVEKAARFVYLNSLCFNGLYRTNKKGEFNVPYGSKRRKKIADADAFYEACQLLSETEVRCCDFEKTIESTDAGDFLYLDPPYATDERRTFTEYNQNAFTQADLGRLFKAVDAASTRGVKFALSYAKVKEIKEFGDRWQTHTVTARRNIAGFSGNRKTVEEVVITNCGPTYD